MLLFTHAEQDINESSVNSLVLHVQEFATEQQYREQRHVLLRLFTNASCEEQQEREGILAVSKYGTDGCKSNDTFVLKSVEDVAVAMDALWCQDSGDADAAPRAIQKFVAFKGSSSAGTGGLRKAWIARPVYRKKDKASWVWILTDSDSSELTDSRHEGCQVVKCAGSQSWADPRELTAACNQSFEGLLQASFSELVLDLAQDSDGKWWLLQVKAFQVRRQHRPISAGLPGAEASDDRVRSAPDRLGGAGGGIPPTATHKKWRCAGKFCGSDHEANNSLSSAGYAPSSLSSSLASPSGFLTKKVLLSCEFYNAYMTQRDMSITSGFGDVSSALAFHLQHQISKRERNQLYESQPLCGACVSKYHFIREQWLKATGAGGSEHQAKPCKRSSSSSSFPVATPPRVLPALRGASTTSAGVSNTHQPAMQASSSAPSVLLRTQQHLHNSIDVDGGGEAAGRPEYLNEMDRIEEMLATHDAKFASGASRWKQTGGDASSTATTESSGSTGAMDNNSSISDSDLGFASKHFSQFLQQRRIDAAESVEEMWKHVSLKPLAASLVGHDRPPKHAYNTLSLSREFEKQQLAERISGSVKSPSISSVEDVKRASSPLYDLEKDARQPKRSSPSRDTNDQSSSSRSTAPVHTISLRDCREVFYDEAYRERVVSEAREQLLLKTSVRVVVMPASTSCRDHVQGDRGDLPPHREQLNQEEEREMAEMAMRTLFLDLSQSAPESITALFRGRPTVLREASGCTTLYIEVPANEGYPFHEGKSTKSTKST